MASRSISPSWNSSLNLIDKKDLTENFVWGFLCTRNLFMCLISDVAEQTCDRLHLYSHGCQFLHSLDLACIKWNMAKGLSFPRKNFEPARYLGQSPVFDLARHAWILWAIKSSCKNPKLAQVSWAVWNSLSSALTNKGKYLCKVRKFYGNLKDPWQLAILDQENNVFSLHLFKKFEQVARVF